MTLSGGPPKHPAPPADLRGIPGRGLLQAHNRRLKADRNAFSTLNKYPSRAGRENLLIWRWHQCDVEHHLPPRIGAVLDVPHLEAPERGLDRHAAYDVPEARGR